MDRGCTSLAEGKTFVYDADGLILGRLASTVADILLKSTRAGNSDQVVIAVSYTHLTLPTKVRV